MITLLATEWIVCLGALLMLGLEIAGVHNRRLVAWLGLGTLLLASAAGVYNWSEPSRSLFNGSFVLDHTTIFFKEVVLAVTFVALLIAMDYVKEHLERKSSEFYCLFLFVCLGMLFLISAGDLVTIFIALELTSMPLYVLAACQTDIKRSAEAGMKFFILGALASAIYLFGAAMLMGSLGTIYIHQFAAQITSHPYVAILGMLCIIAAFAFKIAAAPFHMWAPDVYQGAPTAVTAFLSTGPKVAGVAILMRILLGSLNTPAHVRQDWVLVISVLAVLSMWVGNLVAMHQTNIKRMMAYSGIAHMGYILVGLAAGSVSGSAAVMFYVLMYTLTNLGAWAVIITFGLSTGSEEIADMAGIARRSPGVALLLMLAFLSLAGLPPLAGFIGKFYLFAAAWDAGLRWLALMGVLASAASLFYYLGVLKVVYLEKPPSDEPLKISPSYRLAFMLSGFVIVILGLMPMMTRCVMDVATRFMAHV